MGNASPSPIERIKKSPYFDETWYRTSYPDVERLGMDPATHYLKYGALMQRDPSPEFSASFYHNTHPASRANPAPVVSMMLGKTPFAPRAENVLWAASLVAAQGNYPLAIKLARNALRPDLAHSVLSLEANHALNNQDEAGWTQHLNSYLERFDAAPIALRGEGSIFERLSVGKATKTITDGPLISVIMPAWNAEKTIVKAATSILAQTWKNLELLIVDDCSTDGTWDAMKKLAASDDRVKIIRNVVNVGPYVSKNMALKQARGEWVTGHDADDWAMPDRLKRHYTSAMKRGFDASITYMIRIDETGRFCHLGKINGFSFDGVARKASISCLIRTPVLRDQLGYWDTVRFGADSEMIARAELLLGPKFGHIRQIGMICLSLDSGLTNHPEHGIHQASGANSVRANYRASCMAWLADPANQSQLHLPFPQPQRRYHADPAMVVPREDIVKNLNRPA